MNMKKKEKRMVDKNKELELLKYYRDNPSKIGSAIPDTFKDKISEEEFADIINNLGENLSAENVNKRLSKLMEEEREEKKIKHKGEELELGKRLEKIQKSQNRASWAQVVIGISMVTVTIILGFLSHNLGETQEKLTGLQLEI